MTTSEGGIITTDNEEMADMARILRAHGEVDVIPILHWVITSE